MLVVVEVVVEVEMVVVVEFEVIVEYNYVIVLMMCVLALEYVLEALCYSDWQCFIFVFEGKGVVGGYMVIYYVFVVFVCL